MANVFDMTARGIKESTQAATMSAKRATSNGFSKQAQTQATVDSLLSGKPETPISADQFVQQGATALLAHTDLNADIADAREQSLQQEQDWRNSISGWDVMKKAVHSSWIEASVLDAANRETFKPDPNFNYLEHREELEQGLTPKQVQWLRTDSTSLEHAQNIRQRALDENEETKEIFAHGQTAGTLALLSAGVMDPAGWVAGLGVGKVFQVAGVGSRALMAAGSTGKAVASLAAESAVAGVGLEAAQRAAGKYVDMSDYTKAAGFGAMIGLIASPLALRGLRSEDGDLEESLGNVQRAADDYHNELTNQAVADAGPGATPEDIARSASKIQADNLQWAEQVRTSPVPDEQMMLLRPQDKSFYELRDAIDNAATDPAAEKMPLSDYFRLDTPEAISDASKTYGTDLLIGESPAKAQFINEINYAADQFAKNNPIDSSRLNTLLSKLGTVNPYLASTAQQLLKSDHPVAKMYAQTMLESTTGAGGRRTTGAMDKAMSEQTLLHKMDGYNSAFSMWRKEQGVPWYKTVLNDRAHFQFHRELSEYRTQLARGEVVRDVHPSIKAVSDMLDAGYGQALREQKALRVAGSDNLPETSVGYFPHRLSPRKVSMLDNEQQRALANAFSDQLKDMFDSPEWSEAVGKRIVNRMRSEAEAGVAHNINLGARESQKLVAASLKDAGIDAAGIDNIMRKLYTRGPGYTKKRLNFDLNQQIVDPKSGKQFNMLDFYETDQLKLYRQYVARVSGELALAKRGIPGRDGLDLIREALLYGRNEHKLRGKVREDTLRAFDQTASELLGTPYGKMSHLDKPAWANNLRMLASSTQLNGMGWNQFGEFANLIPALGISKAFQGIRMMPRMLKEVKSGKVNPVLKDLDEVVGEIGGDYKIKFPFADLDDQMIVSGEEMGVMTRAIRQMSQSMRKYTLWQHIASAQTRGVAELIVRKAMKSIREGTGDKALDDMGIDEALRNSIRSKLDKIAQFDSKGRLLSLDMDKVNPAITHRLATAVNRGAKQIIQDNFIGETGYWAHNEFMKLLTQYRTFSLSSMEKQWGRISAVHGNVKALGYLLGTMSISLPLVMARINAAAAGRKDRKEYIEKHTTLPALVRATMNYSSLTGALGDIYDLGASGLGTVDVLAGTGLSPDGSRAAGNRTGLGAIIPSVGYMEDVLKYAKNPNSLSGAVRLMPGGNLPYVLPLINALDTAVKDKSGGRI